jgi:hypothetical protein
MVSANFRPAIDAFREPTIAMTGRASAFRLPRTATSGGAPSAARSHAG